MMQSSRSGLFAGRDVLFLACGRVAVERNDPGVPDFAPDAVLEEAINGILRQLALQLQADRVTGIRRQSVLHIAAVPDDLVDGLHTLERVRQLGSQVWSTLGEGIAERCGAPLQAVQLCSGCTQRQLAVAVGVSQILQVFTATGDRSLFLGAVDVVEVGSHGVIAVAIGLEESVLVAVPACKGDMG